MRKSYMSVVVSVTAAIAVSASAGCTTSPESQQAESRQQVSQQAEHRVPGTWIRSETVPEVDQAEAQAFLEHLGAEPRHACGPRCAVTQCNVIHPGGQMPPNSMGIVMAGDVILSCALPNQTRMDGFCARTSGCAQCVYFPGDQLQDAMEDYIDFCGWAGDADSIANCAAAILNSYTLACQTGPQNTL